MTLDLTRDSLLADNAETVTITVRRSSDTTLTDVQNCLRAPLIRPSRLFAGVELEGNETVWNVPTEGLSGQDLRPGDQITDASGIVFVILSCQKKTLGTRWSCMCRQQG